MAFWEYLEAQYHISDESGPMKLLILPTYAQRYGFETNKLYELSEMGAERWNLTMMLTDLETNISRLIFRRPK